MSVSFHDSGRRPNYLDEDSDRGFSNAVHNGQIRLALSYALGIIQDLQTKTRDLEYRLLSLTQEATQELLADDVSEELPAKNARLRKTTVKTEESTES